MSRRKSRDSYDEDEEDGYRSNEEQRVSGKGKTINDKVRHNEVSQAGRERINTCIKLIKDLLPQTKNVECNKAAVLSCAVQSMLQYETLITEYQDRLMRIRAENNYIQASLDPNFAETPTNAHSWTMHPSSLSGSPRVPSNASTPNPEDYDAAFTQYNYHAQFQQPVYHEQEDDQQFHIPEGERLDLDEDQDNGPTPMTPIQSSAVFSFHHPGMRQLIHQFKAPLPPSDQAVSTPDPEQEAGDENFDQSQAEEDWQRNFDH